jgi:ubiquinol-cytochrome c reductase cytochrome b subunit
MSTTQEYTPIEQTGVGKKAAGPVGWLDDRLGLAGVAKKNLRKVFPEHWSFMLGEIALWSFVVLLLTGVFLTFWYQPSMVEVEYHGSYLPFNGLEMSQAYKSTLDISFDIRGGLLIRQIHHWAAALFIAAMIAHMLRVFFTGAYRKPREINWLIGVGLFSLGLVEGFAGYSLPDDLLSGTGLRFVDGLIRSIPLVGSYIEFFLFGGEFPGDEIIPRLYMAHILLIPAILLGLVGAHAVAWTRTYREERRRLPDAAGVRGQGRRLLLRRVRLHRSDGRAAADQPRVGLRPVQPLGGHGRIAA